MTTAGVIVPIRAFTEGNARLADRLDADARAALARQMAETVVRAAGYLPVAVVSNDTEVRAWAATVGAVVVDDPGGLDAAAAAGVAWCASRGVPRAVVAHADLPWAVSLDALARDVDRPIVTIVPCHRDDGTPVISVPVDAGFGFSYGPSSFRRHAAQARRLGLGVRVVRDPRLAFDVDLPADIDRLVAAAKR